MVKVADPNKVKKGAAEVLSVAYFVFLALCVVVLFVVCWALWPLVAKVITIVLGLGIFIFGTVAAGITLSDAQLHNKWPFHKR